MRTDVVKMYKDVHTWVGIISGLALFIAFYAGAITMFEEPLNRWASAASPLPAPPPIERTTELVDKTLAKYPQARRNYTINLQTGPDNPARMTWNAGPRSRDASKIKLMGASLDEKGEVVAQQIKGSPVANLIDVLHQQVGLPMKHETSMWFVGAISLMYAVALVSGTIVLLPSLVKDLFALRTGKNLKRMWLDVHNALGLFSLPFHIVMATTAVIFAFHDQIYDTQDKLLYEGRLMQVWASGPEHEVRGAPGQKVLAPSQLARTVQAQAPGFTVTRISYATARDGRREAQAAGHDARYAMRAPTSGYVMVDPFTGRFIDTTYMPGRQAGWAAVFTSFFALHFGNFGGSPIAWAYFLLGLAGAFVFYSGNLLWVETRRKRINKRAGAVVQKTSTRVMAALTVGVATGCMAGVSLTIAAAKVLPGRVDNLLSAHTWVYYAAFLAAVGWAFLRGAARGAVELLYACAAATLLIPLSTVLGAAGVVGWSRGGESLLIDIVASAGALGFVALARLTLKRGRTGQPDSVWALPDSRAKASASLNAAEQSA